ncbi:MoxR family ATPase [Macrococcoides goetzii]|nr:MoxR family ATPase [Macrococcus goetzii]TDM42409.1 MoxR family ATPase [Macrococcus goetzii]TDM47606.1 MoxR family ATPase [Macrococcus goetzii]TDM49087.1 MoxR family ATPase [Macrococcus goetzii]
MQKYQNSDVTIYEDALAMLNLSKNVLLKGPTGSGKTKLAETLSVDMDQKMNSINCSVDLDAESLLGYKTIENINGESQIVFVDGPVIEAMREGNILYIDEINMAKPETLPILNGVLDFRRTITNPFTGEVIKAHDNFKVIAAINVGYVGTLPMNEALKNRFVVLDLRYISGDVLKQVILEQTTLKDSKIIDQIIKFNQDLVTMAGQGQISEEASSVRALLDFCDLIQLMPIERAAKRAIIDKLDDEREQNAIINAMELNF